MEVMRQELELNESHEEKEQLRAELEDTRTGIENIRLDRKQRKSEPGWNTSRKATSPSPSRLSTPTRTIKNSPSKRISPLTFEEYFDNHFKPSRNHDVKESLLASTRGSPNLRVGEMENKSILWQQKALKLQNLLDEATKKYLQEIELKDGELSKMSNQLEETKKLKKIQERKFQLDLQHLERKLSTNQFLTSTK
jgi:hypothetical protein